MNVLASNLPLQTTCLSVSGQILTQVKVTLLFQALRFKSSPEMIVTLYANYTLIKKIYLNVFIGQNIQK